MTKIFGLAWLLLALTPVAAQAATADQLSAYMAAATAHAKTDEALAALKAGPEAEFFGPDLAAALVFAAVKVICPETDPPCQ